MKEVRNKGHIITAERNYI